MGTRVVQRTDNLLAAAFLHPHPTNSDGIALFLRADDDAGMERVVRLFPIRTGITVPDWIVVGPKADIVGAAGVTAAG